MKMIMIKKVMLLVVGTLLLLPSVGLSQMRESFSLSGLYDFKSKEFMPMVSYTEPKFQITRLFGVEGLSLQPFGFVGVLPGTRHTVGGGAYLDNKLADNLSIQIGAAGMLAEHGKPSGRLFIGFRIWSTG